MKKQYTYHEEEVMEELKKFFKENLDLSTEEGQKEYQRLCRLVRSVMGEEKEEWW